MLFYWVQNKNEERNMTEQNKTNWQLTEEVHTACQSVWWLKWLQVDWGLETESMEQDQVRSRKAQDEGQKTVILMDQSTIQHSKKYNEILSWGLSRLIWSTKGPQTEKLLDIKVLKGNWHSDNLLLWPYQTGGLVAKLGEEAKRSWSSQISHSDC